MSKKGKDPSAQRFGGEFGPYRKPGTTGVSLSNFKTLVWVSNIGGLLLVVLALELLFVQHNFTWGFLSHVVGVAIALFPSNYEIVGMSDDDVEDGNRIQAFAGSCTGLSQATCAFFSLTWRARNDTTSRISISS